MLHCILQGELDAIAHKELFDAQLLKANTDAEILKAQFDKVIACIGIRMNRKTIFLGSSTGGS